MKYVLFVCTHNAGRSRMAQAFWRTHAPADVRAESAGQEPAKAPWPEVIEVMREVGIDIAGERPQKLDLEVQLHADWAITLGCGGSCPYVPTRVDDWTIPRRLGGRRLPDGGARLGCSRPRDALFERPPRGSTSSEPPRRSSSAAASC